MSDVWLVSMPFGTAFSPSIGLSLLKSELADQRLSVRIRYFTLKFAELTGAGFYSQVARGAGPTTMELAGEWIFAGALFDSVPLDEASYIEEILRQRAAWTTKMEPISAALIARLVRARGHVEAFLDRCLQEIVRERPGIVGFTSVFQQHVASLALARRIKQTLPETFVVFGGANCEGIMGAETIRQFPFVDAVISGEADLVFPEVVRRVLASTSVSGLQGVRTRETIDAEFANGSFPNGPKVINLDDLPYLDFTDYFEQFRASRFKRDWQPTIFMETSRGCWWGEKMHCTFCGLNGSGMAFRSKSPDRAINELVQLTEQYPGCDVDMVDNILDTNYFNNLLPALARRQLETELFYETKSNLKKEQVRMLRAAGVRTIQPGIENLSDSILKLMRKGVSGLQNIQLLKWCQEFGVNPCWNFLWGFPGEPPAEYARMATLIPLLTHLTPPLGCSDIRLDRFSPNFFDAEKLGFIDIAPLPPYRHIYLLSREALSNLACYFTYRYRETQDVETYVRPLEKALQAWKKVHEKSALFAVETGECLWVWDLRRLNDASLTVLRGVERRLYTACDAASDASRLAQVTAMDDEGALTRQDVERRLEPLVRRGLMLKEGARYLALAVPLGEYSPPPVSIQRFWQFVKSLGTPTPEGRIVRLPKDSDHVELSVPKPALKRHGRKQRMPGRRRQRLSPSDFSLNERGELLVHGPRTRFQQRRAHGAKEEAAQETQKTQETAEGDQSEKVNPGGPTGWPLALTRIRDGNPIPSLD